MPRLKSRSELPWMQHIGGHDMVIVGRRRSAAWEPRDLPGCTHWDSARGVATSGSTVTAWTDTRSAVTLGTTGAPQYSGGRVVTNGVNDSVRLTTWAHGVGTGPVSVWLVASLASSAGVDVPIAIGGVDEVNGTYRALWRDANGTTVTWTQWGGGWGTGLSWDLGGASHVWYMMQPGTASPKAVTLGRDGVYISGTSSQSVVSAANGIIVGGWSKSSPYWAAMSVRHVVVCVGSITTEQRDAIHAYLTGAP